VTAFSLGAIAYLNTAPLIEGLADDPEVSLDFAVPSALAARWRGGAYHAALVPVADSLAVAYARIVPGIAIGAEGRCESVKLFHRLPLARVRTVALDRDSVTSNALLRILAAERLGLSPEWLIPSEGDPFPPPADAFLSIGDKTFRVEARSFEGLDLGEAWTQWTGLPFVFATWATLGPAPQGLVAKLQGAARLGRERLAAIARREAPRAGLDEASALRYLRDSLRFDLDARALEGLTRFCELARRHALLPAGAAPRLLGA